MKFKRALVTGGAGFIGSHIAEELLSNKIEVVILDNLSIGRVENIPKDAEFIKGDMLDERKVKRALKGVDIVFHNAAKVSIRASMRKFTDDAKVNIFGTLELLKALKGSQVKRFIYASSMAVYGTVEYIPIDEKHALNPISPYGISKLAGEKYSLIICDSLGIDVISLRYFNTFGKRQTLTPYVGVITIFINRLLACQRLTIFGDGNQIRDFVSVKDVVAANILAMKADFKKAIFNVGSGTGTSVNQIADMLIETIGTHSQVKEYMPYQPGEPGSSIADIRLAERDLKFKIKHVLKDEIPEIIRWIKNDKKK